MVAHLVHPLNPQPSNYLSLGNPKNSVARNTACRTHSKSVQRSTFNAQAIRLVGTLALQIMRSAFEGHIFEYVPLMGAWSRRQAARPFFEVALQATEYVASNPGAAVLWAAFTPPDEQTPVPSPSAPRALKPETLKPLSAPCAEAPTAMPRNPSTSWRPRTHVRDRSRARSRSRSCRRPAHTASARA